MGAYGPGIRVVRDSGVYIVGDVLRIALAWIMLPLYATYLQAAEYGIVAAAATVGAIFVVLSQLGLSAVVVRCCFDQEGEQRRKFLFSLWILIMVVAAILVIVAELAGEWIFARCLPGVAYQPYIRLAILNAWLSSVLVVPLGFLRADSRPVAYVCVSLSGVLMTVLSAWYLLVIAGWATRGALWGQILGTACAAALGSALLISYTGLRRLAKGGLGSALRLGVQEVTYLGANEPEMEAVADIFKEVFIKKDFSEEKIKGRVREIKKGLRLPLDRIWLEKVVSILQS